MIMEIERKVMTLAALDGAQLRQRWEEMMGGPAPSVSPKLLRLALGYRIQADALGGLSVAAQRRLAQVAGGKSVTLPASAGIKLVREWQGVVHVVTTDENGIIRWNDQEWASLSAVARAITGGHWSGPAFFGLRKPLPKVRVPDSHEAHRTESHGSGSWSKAPSSPTGSSPRTIRQRSTTA